MSGRRYAERTKVPVAKSQQEVRDMLKKLGADRIAVMEERTGSSVWFEIAPRGYVIRSPHAPANKANSDVWHRESWRALVLLVKAKMVAIQQGITTIEREFLADTIMPDGTTLIEHAPEMIERVYAEGGPPRLTWQQEK